MKIYKELQNLMPPLTDDEFNQLEINCINEGIREPLVMWGEILVDGHNRYQIAQEHGLDFKTIQKEFDSIDDVKIWIIDNQKGRRNLTDFVKFELEQVRANILKKRGIEARSLNLVQNSDDTEKSVIDFSDGATTRKVISDNLGWSEGKYAMANKVMNEVDEDTKIALRTGETTINKEYQQLLKQKKESEGIQILQRLQKEKEKIEYQIIQIETILNKELQCYKISDKCYLVGEGSINQVYSHLLSNLKL